MLRHFALGALSALGIFACTAAPQSALKIGTRAPDVEVDTHAEAGLGGAAWRPSKSRGKIVVLDFWATWCGPCRASFPALEALYQSRKDKGVLVIGVNEDEAREKIPGFLEEMKTHFPITIDRDGSAAKSYDVASMPTTMLIDRAGVVRHVHSGYHGADEIEEIAKEVDAMLADEVTGVSK